MPPKFVAFHIVLTELIVSKKLALDSNSEGSARTGSKNANVVVNFLGKFENFGARGERWDEPVCSSCRVRRLF